MHAVTLIPIAFTPHPMSSLSPYAIETVGMPRVRARDLTASEALPAVVVSYKRRHVVYYYYSTTTVDSRTSIRSGPEGAVKKSLMAAQACSTAAVASEAGTETSSTVSSPELRPGRTDSKAARSVSLATMFLASFTHTGISRE